MTECKPWLVADISRAGSIYGFRTHAEAVKFATGVARVHNAVGIPQRYRITRAHPDI